MKLRVTMLARTIPEHSKKHGESVCACGWCEELRDVIRLYPLPIGGERFRRWNILDVDVRRPSDDSRKESWRIDAPFERLDSAIELAGRVDRAKMLKRISRSSTVADSLESLNGARRSLGLIRTKSEELRIRHYDKAIDDELDTFTRAGLDFSLRAEFGRHSLMVNGWDVIQGVRKGVTIEGVRQSFRIGEIDSDHLLLVGNMNAIRNRWVVAGIWRLPTAAQEPTLWSCTA